jgi:hypothetical protein
MPKRLHRASWSLLNSPSIQKIPPLQSRTIHPDEDIKSITGNAHYSIDHRIILSDTCAIGGAINDRNDSLNAIRLKKSINLL